MVNEHNEISNDTDSNKIKQKQDGEFVKNKSLSPFVAISIITLIGLVCVVIDFYLEMYEYKEE